MLTAVAESLEEQYHPAWRKLLEARRCPSKKAMGSNNANVPSSSAASGSTQTRQRRPGARTVNLAKDVEAARADLDTTNKTIDDFIRETASYRRAETAVYYQKLRVKWAVEEARLMETELSQQNRTAKSNADAVAKKVKKRHRGDDDEEIPPKSRSKRAKRGVGRKNAISGTTPEKPQARRSKRLAKMEAFLKTGI